MLKKNYIDKTMGNNHRQQRYSPGESRIQTTTSHCKKCEPGTKALRRQVARKALSATRSMHQHRTTLEKHTTTWHVKGLFYLQLYLSVKASLKIMLKLVYAVLNAVLHWYEPDSVSLAFVQQLEEAEVAEFV
jgi:hypothetical protein